MTRPTSSAAADSEVIAARKASIEHIEAAWDALLRLTAERHVPEFLAIDVTMSQAKLLHLVALRPETRMSALAARLHIAPATISGLVDRLVEYGLLCRRDDPIDRRQVMVAATQRGTEVIDRFREMNSQHLRGLLEALEPHELDALALGLTALVAHAEATPERTPA